VAAREQTTARTTRAQAAPAKAASKPRRTKAADGGEDGPGPRRPSRRTAPKRKREPPRAPRQGFEADSEADLNKPVAPPGAIELAESLVEVVGELAQSGTRLLKDALSRLPRS
jgi:hypothetical protein